MEKETKESKSITAFRVLADRLIKAVDKLVGINSLFCILTAGYVLSLIPLFLIGLYDYPAADDYTFGAACRTVWAESHSVIAVLGRAFTRSYEYYLNWAGCMSSSFFMALQPAVFGEGFYKLTPFIMIGILSAGTLYFMHVVFVRLLKCDSRLTGCISLLLLFVTVQCMPNPAEGLFWYNGAAHYTLMHAISLIFYALIISALLYPDERKSRRTFIISALPGLIVGMGNYLTALNVGLVLALLITGLLIGKKFKSRRFILIPTIVFYIAFIFNVAAPGNAVRSAVSNGMNPLKAVLVSFYYVLDYCIGSWSGWAVWLYIIIIATLFWNVAKTVDFDFSYPLAVVVLNYCLLAAMIAPPLFGTGNIEAGRIQSLIFIMYMLLLTFTVCYVTGWAVKRLGPVPGVGITVALTPDSKVLIVFCLIFGLISSALCIIPKPQYYTFSAAAADVLNGNAAAYGKAMRERIELYNESGGMDVEAKALPVKPALLCSSDISEDPDDWINAGVSRFYGLKSVRVKRNGN